MSDILVHTEAGVMTLTFNRVERKNSITGAMYDALSDALDGAVDDAAVRTVLIQGDPTIFSAGNDIGDFMAAAAAPVQKDMAASPAIRFLRTIAAFPKPVVASVCGPAVGIGTTLLFHCDLVYAGDNAAFSMPFVNLGLVPEAASSLLAPQMFGYHRAADRGQWHRADAGTQAGCQAVVRAGGNQAPDEAVAAACGARTHRRRKRELRQRNALAGCQGGVHRLHGEAQTRFLEALMQRRVHCAPWKNSSQIGLQRPSCLR